MKCFFFPSQQWFLFQSGKCEIFQNCHQDYVFLFEQLYFYLGFTLKQAIRFLQKNLPGYPESQGVPSTNRRRREKPIPDTHSACRKRAPTGLYPFRSCAHFWNSRKNCQGKPSSGLPGILVLSYVVRALCCWWHLEVGMLPEALADYLK